LGIGSEHVISVIFIFCFLLRTHAPRKVFRKDSLLMVSLRTGILYFRLHAPAICLDCKLWLCVEVISMKASWRIRDELVRRF
jgi:hypothetical protein